MKLDIERSQALAAEFDCQPRYCQRNTTRVARGLLDRGIPAAVIWGIGKIRNPQGKLEVQEHAWIQSGESILDVTWCLTESAGYDFANAAYFPKHTMDLLWLERRLGIQR